MSRSTASRAFPRGVVRRVVAALIAVVLGLSGAAIASTPAYAVGSNLTGTLVDQVNQPVVGVQIKIYTFTAGYLQTITSDVNGDFSVVLPDDPNYYLFVPPNSTDGAGVEVGQLQALFAIQGADVDLGNVVIKRAVPVSGTITNWTPAMGNLRVQVYEPAGATWHQETEGLSTGATFSVPAILDDGQYTLFFILNTPTTAPNVDAFLGGEYFDVDLAQKVTATAGTPLSGITMAMPAASLISGTVTDASTGLGIPGIYVSAEDRPGFNSYAETYTDVNGDYTLPVVPGLTYAVYADDPGSVYRSMTFDGLDGCGCSFTPVHSTLALPASGIDFALLEDATAVFIEGVVLDDAITPPSTPNPFDGVRVHLYKLVSGVWTEIDVVQSDSSGQFEFALPILGSYRVRFEHGGVWLAAKDGLAGEGSTTTPHAISGCYVDTGVLDASSVSSTVAFYIIAGLNRAGGCASTPVSTSTGHSRSHHPAASGDSIVATPTPTPTPTPTSTPTPSASPSDSTGPTPSASPSSPATTNTAADLWWLWIILVIVLALIVFFLVRLIRGRP